MVSQYKTSVQQQINRIDLKKSQPATGEYKKRIIRPQFVFFASDLVSIGLGFALAVALMYMTQLAFEEPKGSIPLFIQAQGGLKLILAGFMVLYLHFAGLYKRVNWEIEEIRRVSQCVLLIILTETLVLYMTETLSPRIWSLTAWPAAGFFIVLLRMILRTIPAIQTLMTLQIVLIGRGITAEKLTYQMRESRSATCRVARHYTVQQVIKMGQTEKDALNALRADLGGHLRRRNIQIIVAPDFLEQAIVQKLTDTMALIDMPHMIMLPIQGSSCKQITLHKMIGSDMIMAEIGNRSTNSLALAIKRGIDIIGSLLMATLISPVLIAIILGLSLEKGPVFFSQPRVGKNGKRFKCLKFRTMVPDAQDRLVQYLNENEDARKEWAQFQKLTNDPRITKLGAFLRKTSLDELPQILNVLKGDMSLVGARPIIAPEVEGYAGDKAYYYSDEFQHYCKMRPGITGLWQVSGRASTTHDERIRLDRWYVRNWSLWLDIIIAFKTVRIGFLGSGSV